MRVRVLGELEVVGETGRVDLGGPKPRDLVGLLVAAEGRPVPVSTLIDQIWGDRPPSRVEASLQSYVARLRRALEPGRDARAVAQRLRTHAGGYSLEVADDAVDARRFARLLREAQESEGPAAESLLAQALDLWQGDAYAGTSSPALQAEATRLGELRTVAVERSWRLRIDRGRHAEAVAELEQLVAAHPLREQLWGLLALALYRSSRQGDALAALRRARDHLADELGVDPGPELRALEQAVLRQDPSLEAPAGPAAAPAAAAPASPAPARPTAASTLSVFGRDDLLGQGEQALADARAGRGRVVLVSGEAGIGKTRLTEALVDRAAALGLGSGRGGWEPEAAPALWGWSRAVRQLLGSDDVLRTESTDAVSASFRQAEALLDALRAHGPAVLVLDDLHWADTESLRLLRRVAAQVASAPVVLVVATRTAEADTGAPFFDALAALMRLDPLRLDLTGLDAPALTAWVRARTGVTVTDVVARRLADRTDGNPFFVSELVRMLVSEGALTTPDSPVWETVPAGVRDVVRHRLEQLDDDAAEVTAHAAVVGRSFAVDVVAGSTGLGLEQVEQAVETLQVLGLVEDLEPGRYRFSHALVRDAVYERLTATTRSRTHGRVATALEQRAHGEVLEHALELAAHYRQAGPAYARSAWLFSERAALTATERSAHDDALRGFLEAGRLQERDTAVSAPERERVLVGQARALIGLTRPHDSWEPAAAAGRSAMTRGDAEAAADHLLTVTEKLVWGWREQHAHDDGAIALWRQVLAALPDAPSARRAHLRAALAVELFLKPGAEVESGELAEQALLEVRHATADPVARLQVLRCSLSALLHPERLGRRLELYDEMIELSVLVDEPTSLALVLTTRAADRAELGLLAEARSDVLRATEVAQRRRLSQNLVITGWCRAILSQVDEDWQGAEERVRDLEEFQATLSMSGSGIGLVQVATMRELHGRLPEMMVPLEFAASHHPMIRDLHALSLVRAGRADEARLLLGPWREQPAVPRDYGWVVSGVLRAWLWTALEDQQAVADLRAHLAPHADALAVGSLAIAFVGSVELTLGELAAAAGETEAARAHLERSLQRHRELGLDFWARRSQARLDMLPT